MASVIAVSGQVTVAASGTAVKFTTTPPGLYEIRPLSGNTGNYIYVGNDGSTTGDVTSSNGFQLKKNVDTLLVSVTNLNQLWLDADTNGDGACYIRVASESNSVTPPTA